ncbi:Dopey, N-terminal-domain-containing protein [Irpex rosettiformis]|uniref:Dopey, N-terminal-domain-containing protein n=1 Tax=Irpex rosettiformis TaxID=378272 RepID=A0ACB8ULE9_9APHY|nr:Dopey, N-terminal-domain-containing protein [Irpex rosettiformis]
MSGSEPVDAELKRSAWVSATIPPAYINDPKFKKYTQQVEKCLSSFDSVHEWADFISFLKQLLKTFQAYMQFKEIPRKVIVAKRLSQCLNPALPTGVHQRALDVYAHILAVLGSEGLTRDLALWSSGLFPFFEYAATSVKPILLNLFDTHYVPLQAHLRPVMKSFILALLPGLEEETGEFFDKVMGLLDRLSGAVTPSFLLQNIWLIMLTSPSARGTSLNYLSRRLPRLKADEDITTIVGRDIGLMIRAISAALEDDDSLVRRSALDVLLQSLPIDSVAVKKASTEDRAILMRAATSVVLRRDLALNRRLFTWLLGTEEASQQQVAYLKANALDLLTSTLKEEMFKPSSEYSSSRPFKIFISLLDKDEIGLPLTQSLVFDAFRAMKKGIESESDQGEEMKITASTLYEAVEPHAMWKEFLNTMLTDILSEKPSQQGIQMVRYVLVTHHTHDEEIEAIHLPIVFTATLEALNRNLKRLAEASLRETLSLLLQVWRHTRLTYLKERPRLSGETAEKDPPSGALSFAYSFYEIAPASETTHLATSPHSLIVDTFEQLVRLTSSLAQTLLDSLSQASITRDSLVQSLQLLTGFVEQMQSISDPPLVISWVPSEWLPVMLCCLESKNSSFSVVDNVVSTALKLQDAAQLQPKLIVDQRRTMESLTNSLLDYLRPPWASYHVRAVSLIWQLENSAQHPQVVSVISQSLTCKDSQRVREACDAFGVLWRLTDDSLLPGLRLKIPMMIILDTLRSDDPNLRRIGETWMRCSLKSYLRVLDPLLYDLCDPTICRSQTSLQLNGRQVQGFSYLKPFDQRYIIHLFGVLLSVVKFGGQGFTKIARSTPITRSLLNELGDRTRDVGGNVNEATYMDVVIFSLLNRYLQSEPVAQLAYALGPFNESLQSSAVDLLQTLVARGEIDMIVLQSVESAVVTKLYACVHTGRLDLQNKLLHLLHSTISALHGHVDAEIQKSARISQADQSMDGPRSQISQTSYSTNPLLIQTLVDGISITSNRPIIQHWLDFILMTIPQFHEMLQPAILPLNDCVCKQLRSTLDEITSASRISARTADVTAYSTDADFVMLLNAIERLVLLSLSHLQQTGSVEDDGMNEKPIHESSGLFGYMSNVFSSDTASLSNDDQLSVKLMDNRGLHEAIRVLYAVWDQLVITMPENWDSREESLSLIYVRTRTRCRRVLEHLFRAHPLEVLESSVDCWSRTRKADDSAAFELIDVLTSSAQNVVSMLCDCILLRNPGTLDRPRRHTPCTTLPDVVLFDFLEQYLQRLEGPLAMQVWPRLVQLCRDFIGTSREFKPQVFSSLRCFVVLADKLTQTQMVDDKRVRKELQDTFTKLIDVTLLAVRSNDSSSWIRRGQLANGSGRESPIPRSRSTLGIDEKMNTSASSLIADGTKTLTNVDVIDGVNTYLASDVIPNIRKFLVEADKVATTCGSIITSVVIPALKSRAKPLDVDSSVLAILRETTRIPAAIKAWKNPIIDMLNDNRCFNSSPSAGKEWKQLVKLLFETDKTAMMELLGRITTAPSANIFANKEYEMLLRSLNFRRLSYVILTGEKNQFLIQLPTIQEKLVDTLRNVTAPIVQSEVYLCVRILLCRLSPHNLSSFWPVILTELYRVFEQILISLPSDGAEDLGLILAASKLLDLLLVLQTEEFQVHQWIFITDTVDAIYPPDRWIPIALLDRLAEIVGALPTEGVNILPSILNHHAPVETPVVGTRPMRRPLLQSIHQIDSIRDLIPFFSQASITSYESVYNSGGMVDWDAVEDGLYQDMFDGR